jgi:hypothetical protein
LLTRSAPGSDVKVSRVLVPTAVRIRAAAGWLCVEYAAKLRDEIRELRRELTALAETSF